MDFSTGSSVFRMFLTNSPKGIILNKAMHRQNTILRKVDIMIREINVKGVEFSRGRPLVCVPVSGAGPDEVLKEIKAAAAADVIEWRCDSFEGNVTAFLPQFYDACGDKPLLLTLRTAAEGGSTECGEEEYRELLKSFIRTGKCDLIDIEFSSPFCRELIELAKVNSIVTVVSSHDFEKTGTEEELMGILDAMEAAGAHIPKLARMPRDFRDTICLISATEKVSRYNFPIITMSMGKLGRISRLCGEFSGSAMSFGAAGAASAPGQLKAELLKDILDELSK